MRTLTTRPAIPGTALRDAIDSMMKHWPWLTAFLEDPRLPFDSNRGSDGTRPPDGLSECSNPFAQGANSLDG